MLETLKFFEVSLAVTLWLHVITPNPLLSPVTGISMITMTVPQTPNEVMT